MAFRIRVENVVASASLKTEIPLEKVVRNVEGVEYEPDQFPGVVLRLKEPRAACLIFSSGKLVCTGAKSPKETNEAVAKVVSILRRIGIKVPRNYEVDIQNIVASAKLDRELNLDHIAFNLENAEYEPEQFPGLVYRIDDPKVAFLLFGSGKIVCTGAKTIADIRRAVEKLDKKLKELKA
jgi:transcription initiation factor TFIID TATA-box-binding protein